MSILTDDEKVAHLQGCWSDGFGDLKLFETLFVQVLESGAWRSFHTPNGVPVEPNTFRQFVTDQPPFGLGTTPEKVRAVIADNKPALDALDRALQVTSGAPVGNQNASNDKTTVDNVHSCSDRPTGNSESAALRRLRKDRPDLHAKVLDGELSAHAAAIQAGFRPTTFTVRADNPTSIANTLRRRLNREVLKQVAEQLLNESGDER